MTGGRLQQYLQDIVRAAAEAINFVEGYEKTDFLNDRRTQQAVTMSLIIIGEAAGRIMEHHADFAESRSEIPWRDMRGMRNRVAHGYSDINFDLVWDTVKTELPALLEKLQ